MHAQILKHAYLSVGAFGRGRISISGISVRIFPRMFPGGSWENFCFLGGTAYGEKCEK